MSYHPARSSVLDELTFFCRGTVASILRVVLYFAYSSSQLHSVKRKSRTSPARGERDLTGTGFSLKLSILTVVEGAILIITPCLVNIWPLFTRMVPRRFVGKMSCYPRARQHRQWYMSTQMPANSHCGGTSVRVRRDGHLGSSASLADLEEQCWWTSDDGDTTPTCESVFMDNDSKE